MVVVAEYQGGLRPSRQRVSISLEVCHEEVLLPGSGGCRIGHGDCRCTSGRTADALLFLRRHECGCRAAIDEPGGAAFDRYPSLLLQPLDERFGRAVFELARLQHQPSAKLASRSQDLGAGLLRTSKQLPPRQEPETSLRRARAFFLLTQPRSPTRERRGAMNLLVTPGPRFVAVARCCPIG